MEKIFNMCVTFLEWIAEKTGLSYEAVNVIIFVIQIPMLFIILLILLIIKW